MSAADLPLGEAVLQVIEDHEEWQVKVAAASLPAFGGRRSSPWVDYEEVGATHIPSQLVFSFAAELDEEYADEQEAYEDGAREYALLVYFDARRKLPAEHPYADEQFLRSVCAALSEAGLEPEDGDVDFSEHGAQAPDLAHLEVSYEFAAKVKTRYA